MTKETIQKEDVTFVNIYALNVGEPKYIQQLLTDLQGDIGSNTVTAGLCQWQIIQTENGLTGHIRPEELYRDIENVPPKAAEYRRVSLYCILFEVEFFTN